MHLVASDPLLAAGFMLAACVLLVVFVASVLSWRATARTRNQLADLRLLVQALLQNQATTTSAQIEAVRRELAAMGVDLKNTQSGYLVNFLDIIQKGTVAQNDTLARIQEGLTGGLKAQSDSQEMRIDRLSSAMAQNMHEMRTTLAQELSAMRAASDAALTGMRATVEEKLETTLQARISQSFRTVEDQLMAVHKGLGEMHEMARDVQGLRRVLTNVKTRGTFGEVQLGMILQEILTPDQYDVNVATRSRSNDRVEFAVRLPGPEPDRPVWLPIDAKFPLEDYERLLAASQACDAAAQEQALRGLQTRVLAEAHKIHDKYVEVPRTTEFAVLYLPVESLWSEVLRIPGLMERVQRECHVTIAGPTVLAAYLNSLQMGFKTLAIEQKSAEVWQLLGEVRSEFMKFSDVVDNLDKKIEGMRSALGQVRTRTNVLNRRLRDVQVHDVGAALPKADAPDREPMGKA